MKLNLTIFDLLIIAINFSIPQLENIKLHYDINNFLLTIKKFFFIQGT